MNNKKNPTFIYGTAWKEEATADLVLTAVQSGFRAIDTANQRKHYHEVKVGEALETLFSKGLSRDQIFLQTKFTTSGGQDHRLPYDIKADLRDQVHQSFASSLINLKTQYLDSYLLHGPHTVGGLIKEDWEVWRAIEEIYQAKRTQLIGVSNVSARQLSLLVEKAAIGPMMVQNRCYASQGWDQEVRSICSANNIVYQGFSLLTANPYVLQDPRVLALASDLKKTPMQIVFRFATQIGILPLTGTTNQRHMKEDLLIFDFELGSKELEVIEQIANK